MEAPTYLPDLTPTTSNSEAPLVYLIEDDLEQAEHIAIALEQAGCHLQHFMERYVGCWKKAMYYVIPTVNQSK